MSYAKALTKARCESVETTIRTRRSPFAGAVERTTNERLTRRVMFETMVGGENPELGRPEKTGPVSSRRPQDSSSHRGVHGKLRSRDGVLTEGGQESKKSGKWKRGVVEEADCFTAKWHRDEAERSWVCHAAELTLDTAVDEGRKETAEGVARLPDRFCSRDGSPCYYNHHEYDFLFLLFPFLSSL